MCGSRNWLSKSKMVDGMSFFQYLDCHNSGSVQDRDMLFGSAVGFLVKADPKVKILFSKNPRWWMAAFWIYQKCRFATGSLIIIVIFHFRAGFSGTADLMVQLSVSKNRIWHLAAAAILDTGI